MKFNQIDGGFKPGELQIIASGTNGKSVYDYSDELYSDLHKDALGHRPSDFTWGMWNSMTRDEKQQEWNILVDELNRKEAEIKEQQAIAIEKFEKYVQAVQGLGGHLTRKQAAKWIVTAWMFSEGLADDYEGGYFEYNHGLPYGYLKGIE